MFDETPSSSRRLVQPSIPKNRRTENSPARYSVLRAPYTIYPSSQQAQPWPSGAKAPACRRPAPKLQAPKLPGSKYVVVAKSRADDPIHATRARNQVSCPALVDNPASQMHVGRCLDGLDFPTTWVSRGPTSHTPFSTLSDSSYWRSRTDLRRSLTWARCRSSLASADVLTWFASPADSCPNATEYSKARTTS